MRHLSTRTLVALAGLVLLAAAYWAETTPRPYVGTVTMMQTTGTFDSRGTPANEDFQILVSAGRQAFFCPITRDQYQSDLLGQSVVVWVSGLVGPKSCARVALP